MLITQIRENEDLRLARDTLAAKLADRRIEVESAGSIAEAALRINGVFEAAEAAASQYLENLDRAQSLAREAASIASGKAEQILAAAREEAQKIRTDAQQEAQRMVAEAEREAERIRKEAGMV